MKRRLRGYRLLVLGASAVAALGLAGGIAYATIPDSGGVIHSCYIKGIGLLRVIDTDKGQRCSAIETALDFNHTGPQGTTGEPGSAGAARATGAER